MTADTLLPFATWFKGLSFPQQLEVDAAFQELTGGYVSAFRNPRPVAVALVPFNTESGLKVLGVRRAIPPAVGGVALPAGFMGEFESPGEAAAREVLEETGLATDASDYRLEGEPVNTGRGQMLMFYCYAHPQSEETFRELVEHLGDRTDGEASELLLLDLQSELCFPLHQATLKHFLGADEG